MARTGKPVIKTEGIYPVLNCGISGRWMRGKGLAQSHLAHISDLRPSARPISLYLSLAQCYRFLYVLEYTGTFSE